MMFRSVKMRYLLAFWIFTVVQYAYCLHTCSSKKNLKSSTNASRALVPDHEIVLNTENPRASITSPGFPYENYPPNTQVVYEIKIQMNDEVKQLSNRILMTFEMFALQQSDFCTSDGLEISDVDGQIKVFCGVQAGKTILAEGSTVFIRFFSDSSEQSRGFSILLEMYNTGCSKLFKGVTSGTFSSPNYPGRYYADDLCVWKIKAEEGKRILVNFEETFDIRAYEPLCYQDYLAVSLTGNFSTHSKRYCYGKRPVSMYSTRNSMLFMFRTDCCFEGKGFQASFTVVDPDDITTTTTPEPIPQICPCGKENTESLREKSETERIFGGKEVSPPNRYPWMIALVKKKDDGTDDYFCGGAIINRLYVLTAAHCLEKEKISEVGIALGLHDTESDQKRVKASEFIIHPKFNNRTYLNDVALIKLGSALDFETKYSPICLPTEENSISEGEIATVAGWGLQSFNSAQDDTHLKEVDVSVWSNAECVRRYGKLILDTNICAGGEKGKDACGGDSGGPLFHKQDDKWYAVGLVSWGVSCGRADFPGVYTRVTEYLQWIKEKTQDAPPCDDEISPPVQPNLANCGIPNPSATERIVGGVEATPFEYPWMALITYEKRVIGAGALISPYYVITAASIMDNLMKWYPELLDVFLGRHNLRKGDPSSKRYTVRYVQIHPNYGQPTPYNHDLALLRLHVDNGGVPDLYRPICLPRSNVWYEPGLSLTTAGWGSTSNSGGGSDVLRKVDLDVWAEERCEGRYPGWFTDKMICAYSQGKDTCHGDSGAPLMWLYYGRYYLAGLSSWASKDGCAVRNSPRVFSATNANLQWISEVTGLEVK